MNTQQNYDHEAIFQRLGINNLICEDSKQCVQGFNTRHVDNLIEVRLLAPLSCSWLRVSAS
ncbi:hypothetical protein OS493_008559 [Desmophyllum pertusum]|uniref:Uncharacterized protein n=1 Tax=Desmophyllum pertusum TaxID=174260 RepID=A0A9W9ZRA7_9CNID|nr:hypothetical protein OS493_008559 [Desmophyllum pertusum]